MAKQQKSFGYYFRNMPLEKVWEGDFKLLAEQGMPTEWVEAFEKVCRMDMSSAQEICEFFSQGDDLVDAIYGEYRVYGKDDVFFFPLVDDASVPKDTEKVCARVGELRSKGSWWDSKEHACLVASLHDEEIMLRPEESVYLAAVHDIGKKYTAATKAKDELCFPEHATVSAFIAGHWLRNRRKKEAIPEKKQFRISDKEMVAIIYAHMFPKEVEDYRNKFWSELLAFLGGKSLVTSHTMDQIHVFSFCNKDAADFDEEKTCSFYEHLEKGGHLIYEHSYS